MKIFTWMRNANQGTNPLPKSCKSLQQSCSNQIYADHQEFSDWPNGLLAIGTFGNRHSERLLGDGDGDGEDQRDSTSSGPQELEEVGKELRLLLNSKHITVEQLLECLHLERKKGIKDNRNTNRGVTKKSMSFLIKKALLCPPPKFRDLLPDLSRMDKIMRAMLHKKVYPKKGRNHKKYLEMSEAESEGDEEANHRSKWVKTDSEYIVLEI